MEGHRFKAGCFPWVKIRVRRTGKDVTLTLVDEVLAQEDWEMPRRAFHLYSSFNDQVWQQAISSLRNIDENHCKYPMYDDESVLFELIQKGVVDLPFNDDITIGSVLRYMAVMGECLWSLLEHQQAMINQIERHFYKAMSDNHILSKKVIRLEAWLNKMKVSNYSPGDGLDSQSPSAFEHFNLLVGSLLETAPRSNVPDPVATPCPFFVSDPSRRIAVDPHDSPSGQNTKVSPIEVPVVDIPLASLEGRKHRKRERLQCFKEHQASQCLDDPSSPEVPLKDSAPYDDSDINSLEVNLLLQC
ncbi:hypothetical protein BDM02DRAFT_3192488 [Thelephora ganbajun]|uniref:Uncharacterized protein n=1 Tax=Thelephora ganbajun TaxID=370292 RepID=A0ACB6Z095_THEGA|nr:hypothetical protein BDM02DRAFT_3192488 [Thelephora ganbajun]